MKKEIKEELRKVKEIAQIDFERDNRLFIDPYRINDNQEEIVIIGKNKIIKYFEMFFEAVEQQDRERVLQLGWQLHEINATKLGYTPKHKKPQGKGFGVKDLVKIYDEAIKIKDYIIDMPDILVLAENVGPDKVSDLTTNIMYEELLQYTENIANKYNIDIEYAEKEKWIFDFDTERWIKKKVMVPCIEDEEIIFLPKEIVSSYEIFSYQNMYRSLVYPYYKLHTSVHGLIKILKSGERRPDCKKISKKYPLNRKTISEFVQTNYEDYQVYKEALINNYWKK